MCDNSYSLGGRKPVPQPEAAGRWLSREQVPLGEGRAHDSHGAAVGRLLRAEQQWAAFESRFGAAVSPTRRSAQSIRFGDVPFPSNVHQLVLRGAERVAPSREARKAEFRRQFMRWHPDKFLQTYGQLLDPDHRQRIVDRVTQTSQMIISHRETFK